MADAPRQIGLLLLPDFSHLGLACVTETLFVANWLGGRRIYRWRTLSLDGRPVRASAGQKLSVDGGIADLARLDLLLVMASFDVRGHAANAELKSWLRRVARHGATVGGVETGSEIIAAAGLLDGRAVAVHWDNLQGFSESYPRCRAVSKLYTASRNRLTCAGQSATLDMMLAWIAESEGPDLASEVAKHLMLRDWRHGDEPQPAPGADPSLPDDPALRRVLALMERHVEDGLTCAEIAKRAGLGMRRMQRLFASALGVSPVQQYRAIRLGRAHALLQQTELSVTEIAMGAGFGSLEHFCRVYRQRFNCRPSDDRRQSVSAPVMRRQAP